MIEDYGLIEMLASTYRDHVRENELSKIQSELKQLQYAEVSVRRSNVDTLIREIANLKIELNRFEKSYQQLVVKTGVEIPSIQQYIQTIHTKIKRLSFEKNHL